MTERHEIENCLLEFLCREVFAPEAAVTAETDLLGSGFDSMSLVRVLLFVETNYGLWIPEKEINAATLQNVRALATMVSRLLHDR